MKYKNQERRKTSNMHNIVIELESNKQGITDI